VAGLASCRDSESWSADYESKSVQPYVFLI
jgi:hypothetical protein